MKWSSVPAWLGKGDKASKLATPEASRVEGRMVRNNVDTIPDRT